MKKLITWLFFMITINISSQKQQDKIILNNGTIKEGLVKIKSLTYRIKYRKEKGAKKELINLHKIKTLFINEKGKVVEYDVKYKTKSKYASPQLYRVIRRGKANLYFKYNKLSSASVFSFNGMATMSNSQTSTTLFVCKNNNKVLTKLGYLRAPNFGKSFKKRAMSFFNDCPKLVKKLKTKQFKRKNIRDIVYFYNTKCH